MDHSCSPSTNGARPPPPTSSPLVGPIPKAGAFPPIGAHGVSSLLYFFSYKIYTSFLIFFLLDDSDMQPFQPVVSPSSGAIAGWISSGNPSLPHAAAVAAGPAGLVQPSNAGRYNAIGFWCLCIIMFLTNLHYLTIFCLDGSAAFLKHPRTPSGMPGMDYQSADSDHLMKRIRTGQPDEVQIYCTISRVSSVLFTHLNTMASAGILFRDCTYSQCILTR